MERNGVILAIGNQKGGVGKSVTTTNLAVCFASRGKRVLMIDGDPQGNATSQIGLKKFAKVSGKTISQGLINGIPIENVMLNTSYVNLYGVAGDMGFEEFNNVFAGKPDGQLLLKEWLQSARSQFDIIIIDTHPSLDLIFRNVMIATDFFMLPLFAEPESVEGLHVMTQSITTIQTKLNPTLHPLGCVITRYDKRNKTHVAFRDQIVKFGKKHNLPLIGVIGLTSSMAAASAAGRPIVDFNKRTSAAQDYEDLADVLLDKLKPRSRGRVPKMSVISKQEVDSFIDSFDSPTLIGDYEVGESIEI
jgi:chromosome partitioning protein